MPHSCWCNVWPMRECAPCPEAVPEMVRKAFRQALDMESPALIAVPIDPQENLRLGAPL
jgi:thiamine pyrophosphate-dependent acetolactate synthase large subunit-like protein